MNDAGMLFDIGEASRLISAPTKLPMDALVSAPIRNQCQMPVTTLDDLIAKDHPVRAIEAIVRALDLSIVEAKIASNSTAGGRPAIDPRILLTLWIWAVSQGESEASVIGHRITTDDVYRWICGGVQVRERSIRQFRRESQELLGSIFSQVVGALLSEGLVDLHRVTQDGTRVRASAGADSFRRAVTLETLVEEARAHLKAVLAAPRDPARRLTAKSASERGAKERVERIERALARAKALSETKSEEDLANKKKAPRASTSDPEATRMKMPDGGFRPAYNVQFATAADGTGAIVGVMVTDRGNDFGELGPMLDQIEARTGQRPKEALVDGGYVKQTDIEAAELKGTSVYAPEPTIKADPSSRTVRDRSDKVAGFYARIDSEEGKAIYAKRGQVAELANAHAKSRFGLSTIVMRGLVGALSMALLVGITNNVLVLSRERAQRDASSSAVATASDHAA